MDRFYGGLFSYIEKGEGLNSHLRFYPDGTVIALSNAGTPMQSFPYVNPDRKVSKGRLEGAGPQLEFVLTGNMPVTYKGELRGEELHLTVDNAAIGFHAERVYQFYPMAEEAAKPVRRALLGAGLCSIMDSAYSTSQRFLQLEQLGLAG